jgi:hypothetical protein
MKWIEFFVYIKENIKFRLQLDQFVFKHVSDNRYIDLELSTSQSDVTDGITCLTKKELVKNVPNALGNFEIYS